MYDYNSTLGAYLVETKTNYWEILYNGTAVISSKKVSLYYFL
jgi:hypothetical protein